MSLLLNYSQPVLDVLFKKLDGFGIYIDSECRKDLEIKIDSYVYPVSIDIMHEQLRVGFVHKTIIPWVCRDGLFGLLRNYPDQLFVLLLPSPLPRAYTKNIVTVGFLVYRKNISKI